MNNERNGFYQSDYENAQMAFSLWQGKQHETVDEYIIRKRKIELNCLVREVIENELCDTDKLIVKLHWYNGKNISETAEVVGISHSNISRRLDKINETIYDKLKYALQYRYGKDYSDSVRVIIKNKDALRIIPDLENSIHSRIKHLRLTQSMSIKDTSDMTGISEKHLCDIENGTVQATAEDVRLIATAFKTSGDYIIFGKRKGAFANEFNQ
jgi:DNA-directed RNA polymerase specialized sigma subunit